jgi:uncharacterized protein (DUF58 family)
MRASSPSTAKADVRRRAEEAASPFPPLLVEARRIANAVSAGLHGRKRAGPGESFWQHRPYAFGDPVSSIDWRQSARVADRLYVRQNEWESAASVWIWRDPSRSLDYASLKDLPTKRRRADVLAVALASLLAEAGERIGLAGPSPRTFQGRNADARFLDELGVDAFDEKASAPPLIPISAHSSVVYLSDFLCEFESVATAAARLAALGARGVLVQIVDPAEEEFPFAGRTEFEDLESRDRMIFGDARRLRDFYRREFGAHRDRLIGLARRLNWTFIDHRTDAAARLALMAIYEALSDQRSRRT